MTTIIHHFSALVWNDCVLDRNQRGLRHNLGLLAEDLRALLSAGATAPD